jgi:methylenetetrahydrofolate dehydrogenase (NADP+)/methenyltetrahydrofolate cyclohydrolase
MQIIDGRKLAKEILEGVGGEIKDLPFQPLFCDVLVGSDPSSVQYVRMKARTAESAGVKFYNASFPDSIGEGELIEEVKKINQIPNMCGIIVQLPLPAHINRQKVLDAIDPKLDMDCLGTIASTKFYNNFEEDNDLAPPTALACMSILNSLNLDLRDKKVVVLGQGPLVGRPTSALLKSRGVEPTVLTSKSENQEEKIKEADVIISGIGKGKHITGGMIKEGAILVDAGTSELDGGIVGDVDQDSVKDVAGYLSPVPGGVGPVTVAMLMRNVLKVAKKLK